MASVDDVAAAILEKTGPIDTFKLQKLAYYSQAWHLVWAGQPLFTERIEAWSGGPVVPDLYQTHRGRYSVSSWPQGDSRNLTKAEVETVDAVVDAYGHLSGYQLSQLTHAELPWKDARKGLEPGVRGSNEITPDAMQDYYAGIDNDSAAVAVKELPVDDPF